MAAAVPSCNPSARLPGNPREALPFPSLPRARIRWCMWVGAGGSRVRLPLIPLPARSRDYRNPLWRENSSSPVRLRRSHPASHRLEGHLVGSTQASTVAPHGERGPSGQPYFGRDGWSRLRLHAMGSRVRTKPGRRALSETCAVLDVRFVDHSPSVPHPLTCGIQMINLSSAGPCRLGFGFGVVARVSSRVKLG